MYGPCFYHPVKMCGVVLCNRHFYTLGKGVNQTEKMPVLMKLKFQQGRQVAN